jgi:hypothetical protein
LESSIAVSAYTKEALLFEQISARYQHAAVSTGARSTSNGYGTLGGRASPLSSVVSHQQLQRRAKVWILARGRASGQHRVSSYSTAAAVLAAGVSYG